MVTPTAPSRKGLPCVSQMITPSRTPDRASSSSRSCAAVASGSSGSDRISPRAFDRSTPAFAQISPSLCWQMTGAFCFLAHSTRLLSFRITCVCSGVFPVRSAKRRALSDTLTASGGNRRPSAFETILCEMATMSPLCSCVWPSASMIIRASLSPVWISGRPSSANNVACIILLPGSRSGAGRCACCRSACSCRSALGSGSQRSGRRSACRRPAHECRSRPGALSALS